ncbi:Mitochondrial import inner membrane translocase TIM40 [Saitozyma sp. JCM 24511]|nr:Mitochondrial import inner membrane translocase TIM40 [Saitozyma sp. JCM 24511]
MFSSIRPIARSTFSAARRYSTRAPSASASARSTWTRNAVVGAGTLAVGGWALAQRDHVRNDAAPVRESVLDQKTLKEPIHSRDPSKNANAAMELVEDKAAEAEETPSSSGSNEGAFNEETGEINWDCPCLGGMAHGPCGEQFKAAFSCFVFSEAEPKGVDCVELFKAMQDCFREHPDVYGEEIDDDETPLPESDSAVSERPVPAAPTSDPPSNSPILATTQETTPSKGVVKMQPSTGRGDKAPGPAKTGDGVP